MLVQNSYKRMAAVTRPLGIRFHRMLGNLRLAGGLLDSQEAFCYMDIVIISWLVS
jgi:hypothetical protein